MSALEKPLLITAFVTAPFLLEAQEVQAEVKSQLDSLLKKNWEICGCMVNWEDGGNSIMVVPERCKELVLLTSSKIDSLRSAKQQVPLKVSLFWDKNCGKKMIFSPQKKPNKKSQN